MGKEKEGRTTNSSTSTTAILGLSVLLEDSAPPLRRPAEAEDSQHCSKH